MKKIFFASLALLMCGLIIIACAPEKRSKLLKNTITVSIEPTSAHLNNGESQLFTAIVKNNGIEVDGDVFWRIESETYLGTFSSTASKTTTFTAAADKGAGVIIAECSGVKDYAILTLGVTKLPDNIQITAPASIDKGASATLTAEARAGSTAVDPQPAIIWGIDPANLGVISSTTGASVTFTADSVNSGTVTVTAKAGGIENSKQIYVGTALPPVTPRRLIYSDAGLGDNVCQYFGYYKGSGGLCPMNDVSGGVDADPVKSFKFEYNGLGWAGWYIPFGTSEKDLVNYVAAPQDLSSYTKLVCWAKGPGKFRLQFENDNKITVNEVFELNGEWRECSLNITGVSDRTLVSTPVNIVFIAADDGTPAETIYIDYIYFE